jgi:hypothetical protein
MQQQQDIVRADLVCNEIPAWKRLDNAIRSWVIQRQFEEQLENYSKLQEQYK